jgi:hypothetical protein
MVWLVSAHVVALAYPSLYTKYVRMLRIHDHAEKQTNKERYSSIFFLEQMEFLKYVRRLRIHDHADKQTNKDKWRFNLIPYLEGKVLTFL